MKNKKVISITALFMTLICLLSSCSDSVGTTDAASPAETDENYTEYAEDDSTRVIENQSKEEQNDENVIFSQSEIEKLNTEILTDPGESAMMYDLSELKDGISGKKVREMIITYKRIDSTLYHGDDALTNDDWTRILQNRDTDNLDDKITVRWGVTVKRTEMRSFPTDMQVSYRANNLYGNVFLETILFINEPVAVLHTSRDGKYSFVESRFYRGWILSKNIACCDSYEDMMSANESEHRFIVITGSYITLSDDPYEDTVSALRLTMGEKLALAEEPGTIKTVRDRTSYNNYIVKIPTRDSDGKLAFVEAFVPTSADVTVGYMPYTWENVISQVRKTLGEVYGWAGMADSRDCSSLVMEVYRCFGFVLPRNASAIASVPDRFITDVSDMTTDEKTELLKNCPEGAVLYFPGHIMFYSGTRDGVPYCISAVGSFTPENESEALSVYTVAENSLNVKLSDGTEWIEALTKIIVIEN